MYIDYLKLVIFMFIYFTKLNFKKIGAILYKYQQLIKSNSIPLIFKPFWIFDLLSYKEKKDVKKFSRIFKS